MLLQRRLVQLLALAICSFVYQPRVALEVRAAKREPEDAPEVQPNRPTVLKEETIVEVAPSQSALGVST